MTNEEAHQQAPSRSSLIPELKLLLSTLEGTPIPTTPAQMRELAEIMEDYQRGREIKTKGPS